VLVLLVLLVTIILCKNKNQIGNQNQRGVENRLYRHEINLPSTDEHVKGRTISFTGTAAEIDALRKGPVEITGTENVGG